MGPYQLFVGCDHAGFELKNELIAKLETNLMAYNISNIFDQGCFSKDSVDYPDIANLVSNHVQQNPVNNKGLLICGSGQGMAIRANKFPSIRAALVYNSEMATLSREHNDSNILCIGARFCNLDEATKWLHIFLNTPFAGGRHAQRVEKIGQPTS